MNGRQVALEHVCTVEALLGGGSGVRTEATDHGALVVGKGVPVLVVLAGKPLSVVLAAGDGAFLRSLILVRQHVRFQVLVDLAAVREGASALLALSLVQFDAGAAGVGVM